MASMQEQDTARNVREVKPGDEEYLKYPSMDLVPALRREKRSHVPDYLPPFPDAHTFKNTTVDKRIDVDYVRAREIRAETQLNLKKSLYDFFVRTEPTLSLFTEDPLAPKDCYSLPAAKPLANPDLAALMPYHEAFAKDIYENTEEISHGSLGNPFLKAPKLQSSVNRIPENIEMPEAKKQVKGTDSEDAI